MASPAKPSTARNQLRATGQRDVAGYWAANLRLIIGLLLIWLAITILPIMFVDQLNQAELLAGIPLGYALGAQGSPITFILLVAVYIWRMERLDKMYGKG